MTLAKSTLGVPPVARPYFLAAPHVVEYLRWCAAWPWSEMQPTFQARAAHGFTPQ